MSGNLSSNDNSDFTLKGEIKKRRTQEIQRLLEHKRIRSARGLSAPAPDSRRVSQTLPVTPPAPAQVPPQASSAQSPSSQPPALTSPRRLTRHYRYIALAASILLILALGVYIFTPKPLSIPAPVVLPVANSNTVTVYALTQQLQQAGLPISGARNMPLSRSWNANQIMQYDLHQDANRGSLIVLSYASAAALAADMPKVAQSSAFQHWQMLRTATAIVLISPDTSQTLREVVSSHVSAS